MEEKLEQIKKLEQEYSEMYILNQEKKSKIKDLKKEIFVLETGVEIGDKVKWDDYGEERKGIVCAYIFNGTNNEIYGLNIGLIKRNGKQGKIMQNFYIRNLKKYNFEIIEKAQ